MRIITHDIHSGPGLLRLRLDAGAVRVIASPRTIRASVTLTPAQPGDRAAVDAITQATVVQDADEIVVTVPSTGTGVVAGARVPAGQDVEVTTTCADVTATGPLATLRVVSGTGDVCAEQADRADLRGVSGDVTLGRVDSARVSSGTGDVHIDQLHAGNVCTDGGVITVRVITGPLAVTTGSGDIGVHAAAAALLTVVTDSGDIRVTAEPGITIDRSGLTIGSRVLRCR
jgi:DUF4097 and DUF4098 domain-containing protein YvlB